MRMGRRDTLPNRQSSSLQRFRLLALAGLIALAATIFWIRERSNALERNKSLSSKPRADSREPKGTKLTVPSHSQTPSNQTTLTGRASRIECDIADVNGNPVAGCKLSAKLISRLAGVTYGPGDELITATSDRHGRAELGPLPGGGYLLRAEFENYPAIERVALVSTNDQRIIKLVIARNGKLILEASEIAGEYFIVAVIGGKGTIEAEHELTSGEILPVPAGAKRLVVVPTHAYFKPQVLAVYIPEGEEVRVTLPVVRLKGVRGRVKSREGLPVERLEVQYQYFISDIQGVIDDRAGLLARDLEFPICELRFDSDGVKYKGAVYTDSQGEFETYATQGSVELSFVWNGREVGHMTVNSGDADIEYVLDR